MPTPPPGTPTLDLTLPGTAGSVNGAVFMTGLYQLVPDQFSSFLEIRHNGTEQGYNTDGALQQDQRDVQNSTHSILLAEVPIVIGDGSQGTMEGVAYREFRLNLGEAGNTKQYLSLDALQIWQQEAGNLTNFTAGLGFAGSHTNYLAYNLDAGADRWIGLKEGANGNGANVTEYTILIPDSFFINDPAHRYVTLYSEFGVQAGWNADSSSEEWGLSHASGGPVSAMTVHKTATVPGGTANVAGEVISYGITVANVGNTALTGITVTDPSVSNLAAVLSGGFNAGDANHDNQLSAGETWQYTASHTVTQDDLNTNGGGDGLIENTVTADSAQTTPVSATASVVVENATSIDLVKTADVSSADAAGDVINYTINITNTGTVTLTNPFVTDSDVNIVTPILDFDAPILGPELLSPVFDGDYNAGDTNENGVEDPGETFQYRNIGDDNNNGIEDPGETFVLTNVGDTNQNGGQDTGEAFQYYNAGDTNHNGVEDPGETFQFNVDHQVAGVDANHDGFNDGDVNADGVINVGETWQYAVSYTVTQDDIDNGGIVNPSLTHDDTAAVLTTEAATDQETVSVSLIQNPHVTLVKSATVPGGTADAAGEVISYTIAVTNDGNMTLTNPVVSDPSVSNLAAVLSGGFNAGDTDADGKLDLGETWQYTANHTVTQADIDNGGVVNPALTYSNTASVTTDQGASDADANDSDTASVPIAQNPHLTLVKTATVPGGTADAAGEVISYTIAVTNDGNMTLTNPVVSDPSVSNLAAVLSGGFNAGDTDADGKLDLGETWQYTASHTVTQAEMDAGGSITNTASVATDQGAADADANDSDTASVTIVQNPSVTLDKAASVPGGTADTAGEVISYTIGVTNNGNVSLTSVAVSDPSVSDLAAVMSGTFNVGDLNADGSLSVGETWQYTASHTVTQAELNTNGGGDGTIDNTASVTTAQGASANDSASVTVVQPLTVGISIDDNNHLSQLSDPGGDGPTVGDPIQFFFQITNLGNTTLTSVAVSDTLGDAVPGSLQTPVPTTLAGNAVFGDTFNHFLTAADISAGHVVDDITVMALDYLNASQTATYHYDFFF